MWNVEVDESYSLRSLRLSWREIVSCTDTVGSLCVSSEDPDGMIFALISNVSRMLDWLGVLGRDIERIWGSGFSDGLSFGSGVILWGGSVEESAG
jgi:hypothetical protein